MCFVHITAHWRCLPQPAVSLYLRSLMSCSEEQSYSLQGEREFLFTLAIRTTSYSISGRAEQFHLASLERRRCQQTSLAPWATGIRHNWNSYPILHQLFRLCQFCPWVNFALHWLPSSWAICSNLCLITPSLIDEAALWPPAPSVAYSGTLPRCRCERR